MSLTKDYQEQVSFLWKKYIQDNAPMPRTCPGIRPVIYESWKRSKLQKISPLEIKDAKLSGEELAKTKGQKSFLIDVAHSYIINLYSFVKGSNFLIALTDERGYVIDLIGQDAPIQAIAKKSGLTIGCNRSERYAGTNGIGTCLYTGKPIQIWGCEHYIKPHHPYVCSAAPIKNSLGTIIGCLDIVGPMEAITLHTLGMVCAAVDGIEKEIRMKQAYEKIFVMNNQLVHTIQSISSGILMVDNLGIVTHHNHKVPSILKLPFHDLSHKNIADILDISSASVDFLNPAKNLKNKEIHVLNYLGAKLSLSVSTTIVYNDARAKISTVLVVDELQRIHKMITKMSGFTAKYTLESMIGSSPAMRKLKEFVLKVAQSDSNVLILGESGTGKELLAQSIHNASNRNGGPFIAINCGSLPTGLVESELFGYEGGAFTGANKDGYPGKFELAQGGTLFLDEVGNMPLEMQASLLRVIQTREVTRIGGKMSKPINVRIMAATNANLTDSVRSNKFRSDLYYRLNVLSFVIPPLRERADDIPVLADFFRSKYNRSMGKSIRRFSDKALELLLSYEWPGNVRELENVVERAMNLSVGPDITEHDLGVEILSASFLHPSGQPSEHLSGSSFGHPSGQLFEHPSGQSFGNPSGQQFGNHSGQLFGNHSGSSAPAESLSFPAVQPGVKLKEYERIQNALAESEGNVSRASLLLDMPKRTLYRKIDKHQIDLTQFRLP